MMIEIEVAPSVSGGVSPSIPSCLAGECSYRVVRGGSWGDGPLQLRSADRNSYATVSRYGILGFRVGRKALLAVRRIRIAGTIRLKGALRPVLATASMRSASLGSIAVMASRAGSTMTSIWIFPSSRTLCRFNLSGQVLEALDQLPGSPVRQDQAADHDPPNLWWLSADGLLKAEVCERYRDVAVYHSNGGDLAGKNLSFAQRVCKDRQPCAIRSRKRAGVLRSSRRCQWQSSA
jgi:hypothetical protein